MSTSAPIPPPTDPNVIQPQGARDPVMILLLAWFLGGVAYFVLGQWQKGIVAVALWLCAIVMIFVTCGVGVVIYVPSIIAMVVDAYLQAKCLKDGHPIGQWTFFGSHL